MKRFFGGKTNHDQFFNDIFSKTQGKYSIFVPWSPAARRHLFIFSVQIGDKMPLSKILCRCNIQLWEMKVTNCISFHIVCFKGTKWYGKTIQRDSKRLPKHSLLGSPVVLPSSENYSWFAHDVIKLQKS